jgi:hypothetical protein
MPGRAGSPAKIRKNRKLCPETGRIEGQSTPIQGFLLFLEVPLFRSLAVALRRSKEPQSSDAIAREVIKSIDKNSL